VPAGSTAAVALVAESISKYAKLSDSTGTTTTRYDGVAISTSGF